MAKRIGNSDNHDDLLLYGVLGFAVIVGGRQILKFLGIDPANTAKKEEIDSLAPTENPFSNQWKTPVCGSEDSFNGYDPELWQTLKANYENNDPGVQWQKNWIDNVELIHRAFSAFPIDLFNGHYFEDVLTAFHGFKSKQDVANADGYLQANYGQSLWGLLKNGYQYLFLPINNGLNDNDLAQIIDIVNSLPDCG